MRYALTIQADDSWDAINTLIIEDGLAEGECQEPSWKDGGDELVDIIKACGYDKGSAERIVRWHLYFIRNCDDIDLCLTDTLVDKEGKERSWQEYRRTLSQ